MLKMLAAGESFVESAAQNVADRLVLRPSFCVHQRLQVMLVG
jgi:hypothetical protein